MPRNEMTNTPPGIKPGTVYLKFETVTNPGKPEDPSCNVCHHDIIYRHGNDWRCDNNCRCMMMGCVPMKPETTNGTV